MAIKKQCQHFKYCGVYIVREMRGENWSEQFCSCDLIAFFCQHFEDGFRKEKIFESFKKIATV